MATPFDPTKPALLQPRPSVPVVAGQGLLGRAGSLLFGPVGVGVQAALTPNEVAANQGISEEDAQAAYLMRNPTPEMKAKGNAWARGVSNRAVEAAMGPYKAAGAQPQALPQGNPEEVLEPLRRQAKAGLDVAQSKGELPVKEIATALVDKQIETSGEKVSPEDRQKKISQERKLISDLPDNERSDYLSWALIAAGLIAAAVDDSGDAGRAFAASADASLTRAHQARLKQQEQEAAAAEREKDRDLRREGMDREETILEKRFDQQDKMQQAQFSQQMLMLDKQQDLQRQQMAQQAGYQSAMLDLRQQQLEAKLAEAQMGTPPKLDIKQEDAEKITKGVASQLGAPLSEEVNRSVAAQLRAAAKTDPNFDPQRFVQVWLKANQDKLQTEDPWFGRPRATFKPITQ